MVKGVIFLTIDERAERVTLYFIEAVDDVPVGNSHRASLLRFVVIENLHPPWSTKITYPSLPTTRNALGAGGTKASSRPMASVLVAWYTCP